MSQKSADAFRTISEVSEWLDTPAHVLRFWESKFSQVKPVKRAGGRRYYRPADMQLLGGIKRLLHDDGMTIKGVQKLLRENGIRHVAAFSQPLEDELERFMTPSVPSASSIPRGRAARQDDAEAPSAAGDPATPAPASVLPFKGKMNEDTPTDAPTGAEAEAGAQTGTDTGADARSAQSAAPSAPSGTAPPADAPDAPEEEEALLDAMAADDAAESAPEDAPVTKAGGAGEKDGPKSLPGFLRSGAKDAEAAVARREAERAASSSEAGAEAAGEETPEDTGQPSDDTATEPANAEDTGAEAAPDGTDTGLPPGVKEPDQALPGFLRRPVEPREPEDEITRAMGGSEPEDTPDAPATEPAEASVAPGEIPDDPADTDVSAPPGLLLPLSRQPDLAGAARDLAPLVARLSALRDRMAAARRN